MHSLEFKIKSWDKILKSRMQDVKLFNVDYKGDRMEKIVQKFTRIWIHVM